MPAESKKLDTKCLEPFGGKSGDGVLLYLIVEIGKNVIGLVIKMLLVDWQNSKWLPERSKNLVEHFCYS